MPIFIQKQEKKPVLWVDLLIAKVISGSSECRFMDRDGCVLGSKVR